MAMEPIPVLLLKNESEPTDGYAEYFTSHKGPRGEPFCPSFVPVYSFDFKPDGLERLDQLLSNGCIRFKALEEQNDHYGGVIITSKNAANALSYAIKRGTSECSCISTNSSQLF